MGFTALDIVVILLVGGGLVFGWLRGFVAEVLSLLCLVPGDRRACAICTTPVRDALERPVGTASGASVLAFALVFGLVFLGGKLASRRLGGRVRNSVVGPVDRVLGAGFGALKGLIGATMLFLGAQPRLRLRFWGRRRRAAGMDDRLRASYPPAAIDRRHDRRSRRGPAAGLLRPRPKRDQAAPQNAQ